MGKTKNLSLGFDDSDEYILDSYLTWLGVQVGIFMDVGENYSLLAKCLHSIEYFWFVPNDDNRKYDGQKLREIFIENHGYGAYQAYVFKQYLPGCSVLEMMVAMSIHMDELMDDPNRTGLVGEFFWEMIDNVGLREFSDFQYLFIGGNLKVRTIIDHVLRREYRSDGVGGFFPIPTTTKDQREVELWYQMHEYLRERYCVEC
jgi:hypothetical protein